MNDKTFLFTYNFDGAKWDLPITAKTPEEAQARLNRMLYAEYTGELIASIPAPSNLLAQIARFFSRLFRSS